MMHPAISINTLSLPEGPLDQHIVSVCRLGARAISPDLLLVDECGIDRSARLLRDSGLEVATLTHRNFGFATAEITRQARERLMRTIDIAANIDARSVLMTTGGRGNLDWNAAANAFAEAVAPCAQQARDAGIRLGIEPTSHLYADVSIAHRLTDTVTLARKAGIWAIPDLFACWTDADLEAAIADAGPMLALIQVSDYVYGDRGLPCRAVPGDGAIPFKRLIPAIAATGFAGHYDLEIIGPRLASEGHEAGLRRAANHIANLLDGDTR